MTPAEKLADSILKAAGSGLQHYTMPSTREAIVQAASEGIREAQVNVIIAITEEIHGYDYCSGEERGLRRAAIIAHNFLLSKATPETKGE